MDTDFARAVVQDTYVIYLCEYVLINAELEYSSRHVHPPAINLGPNRFDSEQKQGWKSFILTVSPKYHSLSTYEYRRLNPLLFLHSFVV